MSQMVKNLPAMQEAWVLSLGQEYLLEKEMATHSSILAWKIPWKEEPGGHGQRSLVGYSLLGCKELDMTEQLTHTHTVFLIQCFKNYIKFLPYTLI